MPQYMLIICNPAQDLTPEEQEAEHPKWGAYTRALCDEGVFVAGEALQPAGTAATVRVRGGERIVSDGPFAETKEALAGYYIVDVPDLETALDWAARIPSVSRGSVEVRPVAVFADDAATGSAAQAAA
jgi:hypothetical protein